MTYYLYKLKFPYGVHFGADKVGIGLEKVSVNCHCDTFYSAICHEILKLHGEKVLNEFYEHTKSGKFLLSDLLPYKDEELLIPKPIFYKDSSQERQAESSVIKKRMKKVQFIPLSKISEYFNDEAEEIKFSKNMVYEKNAIARDGKEEHNGLYSVGVTYFAEGCGLYFVAQIDEDKKEWFDKIINSLALSGIGGKRTSGYGRFIFEDEEAPELDENNGFPSEKVLAKLLNEDAKYYLSMSTFYPKKEEIKDLKRGYYSLVKRGGFVQSATYSDKILKKIPTTFVSAGSCFEQKFEGEILDVSKDGNHPVYRYGKPIMIGINV
jgi:CRISPR-associated protein Csm4